VADSYIGIDEPTTIDKKLDTEQLTVGSNTVERERVQIAGSTATQIAPVSATDGLLVNLGANNDVTVTGTVTANLAAGTNNIGDVDVLSVPAPLSTTGGGTEATAQRVTIANDSTGVLSVDDNGGSLTVDGTVAVSSLPALVAGTANIGDVDVLSVPAPLSTTGGGTEAAALRVTLANDSTGVVSVDDNGASLTVDGTVTANLAAGTNNIGDVDVLTLPALPAGDNAIGRVKITDGTDVADVLDLTNSNPVAVAIVDGSGTQITSFGGGTQYTEDAAAAADPVGTVPILVRKDTPAAITSTDGDNVAQRGTNYGAAFVQVVSSAGAFIDSFGGSGGTAQADRSSFTDGTTNATPIAGVYNETASDPTEDQAAAVRLTAKRAIHVNLRDATGAEVSVGGGTQYDEDTASAAGEKLTMAGVVRADTAASQVGSDGDRTVLVVDANGRLHVNGSGVTQPVSAASLPLPTGASTLAEQQTQTTALQLIDDAVATVAAAVPTKGLAAAGTDGTNARLLKTDTSGELQVDVLTLPALVAGTANIGDVDVLTVPAPLSTTGGGTEATALRVTVASDSTGVLSVDDNGSSLTVDNAGTFAVQPKPETSGGLDLFRSIDLDETEEEVKASAGQVYGLWFSNLATSTRFLKFYNATAASVTVGTTTPVLTLALPGNSSDDISGVFSSAFGIAFSTAITVAATTGVADTDTGAPGANEVLVNIFYK
jgi:hypothetical protein